jgi:thiamine-phosphate pyrophosphorylase
MLLCYITDRKLFPGSEAEQRRALLQRIGEAAAAGIDYIHLREMDLNPGALEALAREAVERIRESSDQTRLLIDSRVDVAIAAGADGVNLSPGDINASDARAIWAASLRNGNSALAGRIFTVAVSCHSPAEVRAAESHGADFVVLSPIFDRASSSPNGLESLRQAALLNVPPDKRIEAGDHRVGVPLIASGGITLQNAPECLRAGAAGLAGTRLFQTGDLRRTIHQLRELSG